MRRWRCSGYGPRRSIASSWFASRTTSRDSAIASIAAGDGQPRSVTTVTDPAAERIKKSAWLRCVMADRNGHDLDVGDAARDARRAFLPTDRAGTFAARAEPRVLRTAVSCLMKRGSS